MVHEPESSEEVLLGAETGTDEASDQSEGYSGTLRGHPRLGDSGVACLRGDPVDIRRGINLHLFWSVRLGVEQCRLLGNQ